MMTKYARFTTAEYGMALEHAKAAKGIDSRSRTWILDLLHKLKEAEDYITELHDRLHDYEPNEPEDSQTDSARLRNTAESGSKKTAPRRRGRS